MALTSTAEQKQHSYLRGFLLLSELLIHHVSSLFCSEMQEENLSLFNWRSFLILERQDSWYDSEFEDDVAYVNKWKKHLFILDQLWNLPLPVWEKKTAEARWPVAKCQKMRRFNIWLTPARRNAVCCAWTLVCTSSFNHSGLWKIRLNPTCTSYAPASPEPI